MQFFGPLICCLILYLSGVTEATIFTDCEHSTGLLGDFLYKDIEPGDFRVLKTNVDGEFEVYALPPSDMCNHLTPACPIRAGRNYTYSFTDQVMMFFRQGLLDARWVLLDAKNETFVCVEFPLDIKGPEN
ncbi:hypothetical protein CSKR_113496 [Clonorchis sinensis]|uniref:MD-2-related lipid-recognition domain-containing protein n=1 Tax=Clonorchis sinensis TaxID=79923 RepID=A0A8T1MA90_CLOSI|nr:hypothetical protein CSKR_113496 [Clonorchis sinensis]